MKKKLEADLMSIAHRVLQMKNKSDINQLCVETQKLYEKLSILRFVEEHFGGAKPTIGQAEIVEKMKQFFEENQLSLPKPTILKEEVVEEEAIEEEIVADAIAPTNETDFNEIEPDEEGEGEEIIENIEEEETGEEEIIPTTEAEFNEIDSDDEEIDIDNEEESNEDGIVDAEITPANDADFNEIEPDEEGEGEKISEEEPVKLVDFGFLPAFELDTEKEEEEIISPKKIEAIQISFEELLGKDYSDTLFVKADSKKEFTSPIDFEIPKSIVSQESVTPKEIEVKSSDLNDKLAAGISIGLNDKIAFVKQLFGNSDEDYNRVMNQLITFDNFQEAQSFIEEMVKPDYNNWEGKEDYEQRFIEIIEKKFA